MPNSAVVTSDASSQGTAVVSKRKPPIFVVGCHRSGTSFLYHCLLSSGNFVLYRSDSGIWERLIPLYGDPAGRRNREKMVAAWLKSKLFRRTGLEPKQVADRLLADCRTGGEFLSIVMQEMARVQQVERWAAWDPDNTFYMPTIKREIPDALFIHIIRDGRDVATVLDKKGWIKPYPWDKRRSLLVAGVFWGWMVQKGREYGAMMKKDYLEVRYEDLAMRTDETLQRIGAFIGHDMNYERILQTGVGAVSDPNSTFGAEVHDRRFNPVGRWKEKLSGEQITALEEVIGDQLKELDYPLTKVDLTRERPLGAKSFRTAYLAYFNSKLWLKSNTPFGRFASTEPLELA
jgi:sulfotransferase family protein